MRATAVGAVFLGRRRQLDILVDAGRLDQLVFILLHCG